MNDSNRQQGNQRQGGNQRQQGNQRYRERDTEQKYFSEVIELRRVTKVTAGAKRLRFSAVVAVGDKKGSIGIAMGKGADPQEALQKAIKKAQSAVMLINWDIAKKSIPHRVEGKYKASSVIIKPAPIGTGVVAGGSVRKIVELAGIENIVSKSIGSSNSITNAYCAITALTKLKKISHASRTEKVTEEK